MKKKIINDPLYGFVSVGDPLILDLIAHPWFQRLRHIRQLGMADMVYPGAGHSRFQHALGAFHLMGKALESLQAKGVEISAEEAQAARVAILLHDIGHGPLSHALEDTLLPGVHHESITYRFLMALDRQFNGRLQLAMRIFRDACDRRFLHQLVSSQLDMDRLDYLERDSFFTGVREGHIGVDRIIDMLHVYRNELVVEEKGVYSLENFITSRRLMYWQVYLHKTALASERMLVNAIRRAQTLAQGGHLPPCPPALGFFLERQITLADFSKQGTGDHILQTYSRLDDHDIWSALKSWQHHPDKALSMLAGMLIERRTFEIRMSDRPVPASEISSVRQRIRKQFGLTNPEAACLVGHGSVTNEAYVQGDKRINVLMKDGKVRDLARVSGLPQIRAMSKLVRKYYLCFPRDLD